MNDLQKLLTSKLSKPLQAVLKNATIDDRFPGPLLTNITRLIEAIGTGLPTSSDYFSLPQRVLSELNQSLLDPMPHDLKRPQLRSFPDLMGLFMLLRSTGLAVGETKPKRVVLIDPAMLAYQFDHDHLYRFAFRGTKGRQVTIAAPYLEDDDYFADEIRVGDVPLLAGDTLIFHYDFGDDWRFQVTLESVDETPLRRIEAPELTAQSGEAPEQYAHDDW